jgi:gluconolactonase
MKTLRGGYITLLAVLVLGATGVAKEKTAKEKPAKKAAKSELMAPGAEVRKLVDDFKFTEGPAGDAVGDVYFCDIPNNRILKWSLDGKLSTFLENSGGANGTYFDKSGNLLACQGEARRLVSISPKGEITVLADQYNGKKFNSPNDLWVDPKGGVYFTDPRYGNREGMEQDGEHVYYLTPDRKTVIRVISDMVRPNGLIGTLTDRKLFASEGSDGMTIDNKGNVYLSTKVVAVYNKRGKKIEEIPVPEQPANLTFAGADNNTLFITARTSLYAVDMRVSGAATPLRPEGQKAPKPKATKEAKKTKEGKQSKRQQ